MYIRNKNNLNTEMLKLHTTIKEGDVHSIAIFKQEYQSFLAIPKGHLLRKDNINMFMPEYSYHLLSLFLLLDIIDNYLGGNDNVDIIKSESSLYSSLNVSTEKEFDENKFNLNNNLLKVASILRDDIYIYLLPFENEEKDYEVKISYPGTIIIVYNNENSNFNETFYNSVGEVFLNKKLKNKIPYWAKDKEDFIFEFNKWCKKENSKFKNK